MNLIKKSESFFMKIINLLLIIITFGKQKEFMTRYVTTIGEKIYIPSGWDDLSEQSKDVILAHEAVHVAQYRANKFFFYLKYLLWPLPVLHAHARLEFELEAYATQIVYSYRKYGSPVLQGVAFENCVNELTGPSYFWTCINKQYVSKRLTTKIFEQLKKTKALK